MDDQNIAKDEPTVEVNEQGAQFEAMLPNPPDHDGVYLQRMQSIANYRQRSLNNPDVLLAVVAGVNGDLIELALQIGEALRQSLAQRAITTESIDSHTSSINLILRASKQVTQLSQLELRASKAAGRPSGEIPQ